MAHSAFFHLKPSKSIHPPTTGQTTREVKNMQKPYKDKMQNMPLDVLDGEERPIPDVYKAIDNDLARDNLEIDLPAGDLEDL